MSITPITNYKFTGIPIRIIAKENNIGEDLHYYIMKLSRTEKFGATFLNDRIEIPEPTQKILNILKTKNIKYESILKKD